jgi:uncharacterized Ntn-hydrolase superfamily protein
VTYSILGWDADTGEMGGAIQSHFFAIAPLSLWMEPGVGVVATQMIRDPGHGPRALAALAAGLGADAALRAALSADPASTVRQVAVLDAWGATAAHSGAACVPAAGHLSAPGHTVQGAMLRGSEVWARMAHAFASTRGPLAARLLAALESGEAAGGDLRGQRAAALRVVAIAPTGDAAIDRPLDLRVDDSPTALGDLRRLYELHRVQDAANRAFELGTSGKLDDALDRFDRLDAVALLDPDVAFRHALLLAMGGRGAEARERLAPCYARGEGWRELVRRLPSVGFLPDDAALLSTLLR